MNKNLKYILLGLVALISVTVCVIIYRMFFQFDRDEIVVYVREEANKYGNKAAAFSIIIDGVEHILSSHNLTQQVLRAAKASGTDKEQELVAAAIAQCKAFEYLQAKPGK